MLDTRCLMLDQIDLRFKNSKFECRMSKQQRNVGKQNQDSETVGYSNLFRISDFDIRIWPSSTPTLSDEIADAPPLAAAGRRAYKPASWKYRRGRAFPE